MNEHNLSNDAVAISNKDNEDSSRANANFLQQNFIHLIVGFGTLLLTGIFISGVIPQKLDELILAFDLSAGRFGIVAATIAILSMGLGATAIWTLPRLGVYRVCLLGYAFFGSGLFGVILTAGSAIAFIPALFLAWGLAYFQQGNTLVVQLSMQRATELTNLLHGFNGLGRALGILIVLAVGYSWIGSFAVVGTLSIAILIIGVFAIRKMPLQRHLEKTPEDKIKDGIRKPAFWAYTVGMYFVTLLEFFIIIWLPLTIKEGIGLDQTTGKELSLLAMGIVFWVACAVRFWMPIAVQFISENLILFISLLCVLAILICTEMDEWNSPLAYVAYGLCGFSIAVARPTSYAKICKILPRHTGLLSIAMMFAHALGMITVFVVGGFVVEKVGHPWAIRIAPMAAALTFFAFIVMLKDKEQAATN